MIFLLLTLLGFIIGAIDAIINGGNLLTIALFSLMGLDPLAAVVTMRGISLLQTTTAVISFTLKKMINWPKTLAYSAFAVAGSLVGANLVVQLPQKTLSYVAASLMLIILVLIPQIEPKQFNLNWHWLNQLGQRLLQKKPILTHSFAQKIYLSLLMIGIGFYGGFFGAGVGVMLVVAFFLIADPTLPTASANAKVVDLALALSATTFFMITKQTIIWQYFIPLSLGSMVGSFVGVDYLQKINHQYLRWGLAVMVVGAVVKLVVG